MLPDSYIILYADDFDGDVWQEYCDSCGVSHDSISITIMFNSSDVKAIVVDGGK